MINYESYVVLERGKVEPISIAVGSAVAKWAFKLWAGDTPFADLGADLAGIVGQKIPNPFQARSVGRQFEQLADEIAKRLEPYLAHEIKGLDEGEREAVCLAAKETLDAALIDTRSLLRLDLDPARIRSYMHLANPEAVQRSVLSQAGESLYNAILTEISEYVSSTAVTLPGFATHQAAELLSRESQIIELLLDVLNKLPRSEVPQNWSGHGDLFFENEYRKRIFRYADRLQLFGVNSSSEKVSYSLSVAYISMSVDAASPMGKVRRSPQSPLEAEPQSSRDYLSVEEALSVSPYVMVSGSAGSGKTTLVQWIAASASNKSFSGHLSEWNGKIPFILPLRRFVDEDLPGPEDFVRPLLPSIADTMPRGWVHRALDRGNAIVLVDGLDEVPIERRLETKAWLEDLIDNFPGNRYIVTSRTTALSPDITNSMSFHHAQLLPMELTDIKSFVAHWHAAAIKNAATEEDKEAVQQSERFVLDTIRDRSNIRSLCNSPLLCALVCALNRDRGGNIPENRMDLYETALKMLVVRRDEARRIPTANVSLNYREAFVLLSSFALWLHENSHTDADKGQFENRIGAQLGALHRIASSSKEAIAQHLLVRSGVLREPIPGRVDFVHRTFLEYLAAAAIVEDDSIEKLILHGHEDYWREVIILAAGHAKAKDREHLIRGLISRGNEESDHTHSLFLLAVACMETSTELSPGLQAELQECLRSVMPPRNMTDAAAVASAGSIAVPLLANFKGNAVQTAACVRSLVLIGGEEALTALVNFRRDTRVTVIRELVRGWSSFPLEYYLERVLAGSLLDRGHIVVRDVDQLTLVGRLINIRSMAVDTRAPDLDFSLIPGIDVPVSFFLGPKSGLVDMGPFLRFPSTRAVSLRNCDSLMSLNGVENLQELRDLDFEGCSSLAEVEGIGDLKRLSRLNLSGTAVEAMPRLQSEEPLQFLGLAGCRKLSDLGEHLNVRQLDIHGCSALTDFDFLAKSLSLASLTLSDYHDKMVTVTLPPNLFQLDWYGGNIDALSGAHNLRKVLLGGEPAIHKVVDFVLDRPFIDTLDLGFFQNGEKLEYLEHFSSHPELKQISLFLFNDQLPVPHIEGFELKRHRHWIKYSKKGSLSE